MAGSPGMSGVVSCVRNSMVSDGSRAHLRWFCSRRPRPVCSCSITVRVNEIGDLRELGSYRRTPCGASYDEPRDTSDRRLQPTSFIFKDEHPRLVQLPKSIRRTSLLRSGGSTERITVGRPASADCSGVFRRRRFLSHVDRFSRASDAPSSRRRRAQGSSYGATEGRFHHFPREGKNGFPEPGTP